MPTSGVFSRRNTLRFTTLGILSLAVIPTLTACGKDYQGEVKLDSYDESAGSYEPATKEHPAQNVPKPKKPQDINDDSTGGLYSTLAFAAAAMQYALRTGDTSYLQEVNIPERTKVFFMSNSPFLGGTTWTDNPVVTIALKAGSPTKDGDTYTWPGHFKVDFGAWTVKDGTAIDTQNNRLNLDQDIDIKAKYQNNAWTILSLDH